MLCQDNKHVVATTIAKSVTIRSLSIFEACASKQCRLVPILLACVLCLSLCTEVSAQFYVNVEEDSLYKAELTFGLNVNTSGGLIGGLTTKYSRRISSSPDSRWYHHFVLDIVNIKHPKEVTYLSPFTGQTYIGEKRNHLLLLRPLYGRERVLFRKAREQGVQINASASVGPAVALVSPYFIRFRYSRTTVRTEQYDPDKHSDSRFIEGAAGYFASMSEISPEFGFSARASLSFEFGAVNKSASGCEVGVTADWFPKPIELMAAPVNESRYVSVFMVFFFGSRY